MPITDAPIGGAFLIEDAKLEQTLTVEEMTAEDLLMAKTVEDFMRKEVLPLVEQIEAHDNDLIKCLMQKAAALGLLCASIPEVYGGLDLKKSVTALVAQSLALEPSFSVSLGAHTSIGTLG